MPENPYEPPKEGIIADGPHRLPPLFWIVGFIVALIVAAPALIALGYALAFRFG